MASSSAEANNLASDSSDRLVCTSCHKVIEEPHQHLECGRIFCQAILSGSNIDSLSKNQEACPEGSNKTDNVEPDCPQQTCVITHGQHKTRESTQVACPLQCTCPGEVLKENSEHHAESSEFCFMTPMLIDTIKKLYSNEKIACDKCGQTVERGMLNEHQKSYCEYSVVACRYERFGCSIKIMRRDLREHELRANKMHLDIVLKKLSIFCDRSMTLSCGAYFAFKVSGFKMLKENNKRFYSDPFNNCQEYKMQVLVDCNGYEEAKGTHVSVSLKLLECHKRTMKLDFNGVATIVLLNQLHDDCHLKQHMEISEAQVGDQIGIRHFIAHSELFQEGSTFVQYLVDDSLYFRITAFEKNTEILPFKKGYKVRPKLSEPTSVHRRFTLKLQNYTVFTTFAYSTCINVLGHNVPFNVKVYAGSDFISVQVHCHVFSLFPRSRAISMISLLNQLEDRNHHSIKQHCWAMHEPIFIPKPAHGKNLNIQYLKDDTLYLRVDLALMIEGGNPWLESDNEFASVAKH